MSTVDFFPAAPQEFVFGGRSLHGNLVSFSGDTLRRFVSHEAPKRDSAEVEDMGAAQRHLDVNLIFLTEYRDNVVATRAADAFRSFLDFVRQNPFGLLVHPSAGRWQAFCPGVREDVSFDQAVDRISVRVQFLETISRAVVDVANPAAAAQTAASKQSAMKTVAAQHMSDLAKAQNFVDSSVAKIDSAASQLDQVTDPIDFMRSTLSSLVGIQSEVLGKLNDIADACQLLSQDITDYVVSTSDTFTPETGEVPSAAASSDTLLGLVLAAAQAAEDIVLAADVSPAGSGDLIGSIHESAASCLDLQEAVQQSKPPLIRYTVRELIDIITLARRLYGAALAVSRASDIISLNHMQTPGAIPAGTVLQIPAR